MASWHGGMAEAKLQRTAAATRSVLVTGGSRGLGLGIAKTLASAGYRVIVVARKQSEQLTAAIAVAQQRGPGTLDFVSFDFADIEQISALVRKLRSEFGSLFGLVNNAGIGDGGVLAMTHNSRIEELVRINTLAPIVLTKYVLRGMMSARDGRIVNIASIVGFTGYTGLSVYAATKASILGFTRSLAREVGQLGITVNAVAPGFIATDMTHELTGEQREQIIRRSALKRLTEVEDVANAVEYLLSEKARNISGTVLTIDAGATA
jgi:3-oxoacyl-[acyl-carrier protein] reductase